jgi:hypothetical protein
VTALLVTSCNRQQAPALNPSPIPDSSLTQTAGQSCARPILDDPAASAATDVTYGQISVPGVMVNRFAAAARAMQAAADARDMDTARCGADNILYVLVGRGSRHAPADALSPGILPLDRDPLSDPGLAMTAMSIIGDQAAVDTIATGLVGNQARWTMPTTGWNELDAAVANGSVATLDSPAMQVIGYALLIQGATTLDEARSHGRAGLPVVLTALQTSRDVLSAGCRSVPEAVCRL